MAHLMRSTAPSGRSGCLAGCCWGCSGGEEQLGLDGGRNARETRVVDGEMRYSTIARGREEDAPTQMR